MCCSLVSDGGGVSLMTVPDPDHTSCTVLYSPAEHSSTHSWSMTVKLERCQQRYYKIII